MKTVRVKVPATVGNLGPGFDVLGMALKLYTVIELSIDKLTKKNNTQLIIEEKDSSIPGDKKNIIWLAAKEVFKKTGKYPGKCVIRSDNKIPLARGLGSSAAARVGGLAAANKICGGKLSEQWLLDTAARLEGHPDNVAPAIFGGIVRSSRYKNAKIVYWKIGDGKGLRVVLHIPEYKVITDKARKVFPKEIAHSAACKNMEYFSVSCTAYSRPDYSLLDEATKDFLHQPYRKKLIHNMDKIFRAAMNAGAYGVVLSGSGPVIAALCSNNRVLCNRVGKAMVRASGKYVKKSKYKIVGVA